MENPCTTIIDSIKEEARALTNAQLCVSWASFLPARKADIYEWCKTLGIAPAHIYAYTWRGEDFYIIPESHISRELMSRYYYAR